MKSETMKYVWYSPDWNQVILSDMIKKNQKRGREYFLLIENVETYETSFFYLIGDL